MAKYFLIPVIVFLSGCQFWIAGHSVDKRALVIGTGTADPAAGTTVYTMEIVGANIICKVTSSPNRQRRSALEPEAWTELTCDDGRTGKGESTRTTLDTGVSKGTDSCGNMFVFDYSINQDFIAQKEAEYRAMVKRNGGFWNDKCVASTDAPKHSDPLL